MKLVFLGTSSAVPTRTRNVSALGLVLPQRGTWWLFDCGEGTQHQVMRSQLSASRISNIFISHLHGDHVFGLPGLLASRSLLAGNQPAVTILGPSGIRDYIETVLRLTATHLAYPLIVKEVKAGAVFEDAEFSVQCVPVQHGREAFAYVVCEKDRPGRFDVEKARSLGIPSGPVYARLKSGEEVTLEDGRVIKGRELVGPVRPGRKLIYSGDTATSETAFQSARDADVLVHEATYMDAEAGLAKERQHSTARQAAEVAQRSGAKTLILTHISPRYEGSGDTSAADLLDEARAIFPRTFLAEDFWTYEIPFNTD